MNIEYDHFLLQESAEHKMPSLLVVFFGLQLAIHLVNTLGAATINSIVCQNPNVVQRVREY